MLIETHCHLDYLKDMPLDEMRKKISEAGISKVITIGVDPANLDKVKDLSEMYPEIYFTQGIHPHDSKEAGEEEFEKISARAHLPKMVAVGEIGLDYHYNNPPPHTHPQPHTTQSLQGRPAPRHGAPSRYAAGPCAASPLAAARLGSTPTGAAADRKSVV